MNHIPRLFFSLFSSCLSARLVPRCAQTASFTPTANAEYAQMVLGRPHPVALFHLTAGLLVSSENDLE